MIKDHAQKIKAVRYSVALGFTPHIEVLLRSSADTGDVTCDVTDLDAFAIKPAAESPARRMIFDCKTLNKLSPINRAIWAKGLLEITRCDESIVILSKEPLESHRFVGNSFGVRLFSEKMFDEFAASSSPNYLVRNSYIEISDGWDQLAAFPKNFPKLKELSTHLNSTLVLEQNGAQGIRSLMASLKNISGELDPCKKIHRSIFYLIISQFAVFASHVMHEYHNIFDSRQNRKDFERTLRYYIWGGRENYEIRERLNQSLKAARGKVANEKFDLPGWDRFVGLIRTLLDAPHQVYTTALPIKDLAFRVIAQPDSDLDRRLSDRFKENNRVRQFSKLMSTYLCEATRIPKEFSDSFSSDVDELMK